MTPEQANKIAEDAIEGFKIMELNKQIKQLKDRVEELEGYKEHNKSYARYCVRCKKITFDADTYGTWDREKNEWHHYNCK